RPLAHAESGRQLPLPRSAAAQALGPADNQRLAVQRHEIGDAHPAVIAAVEFGPEHQRLGLVLALHLTDRLVRCQLPETVFLGAEQLAETGGRIKPRWAEPVDTAVAPDQRCAAQVTEQRIVLDRLGHEYPCLSV